MTTSKLHHHDLEESHKHVEQNKPDAKKVLTILFHGDQVQNQTKLDVKLEIRIAVSLVGRVGRRVSGVLVILFPDWGTSHTVLVPTD